MNRGDMQKQDLVNMEKKFGGPAYLVKPNRNFHKTYIVRRPEQIVSSTIPPHSW